MPAGAFALRRLTSGLPPNSTSPEITLDGVVLSLQKMPSGLGLLTTQPVTLA